jgi:DNA-binding CsgD family transcriptional regulator
MQRLTPRQKDCLRLVAQGHQSKSIARELGISPLRIDKHISDARRILGTGTRTEAAHLLKQWEQQGGAARNAPTWGAPPLGLPKDAHPGSKQTANESVEGPIETTGETEPGMMVHIAPASDGSGRIRSRSRRLGRRNDNDLGIPWTFALLVAIAAVCIAAGAIVSLLLSLSQAHH